MNFGWDGGATPTPRMDEMVIEAPERQVPAELDEPIDINPAELVT